MVAAARCFADPAASGQHIAASVDPAASAYYTV